MKMRGLKNAPFIITEHIPIDFSIFGQTVDGTSPAIINITRHIYITERLKPKMFIKDDILNPEMNVSNIEKSHLTIGNCKNMTVKFNMRNIGPPVKRVLRSNEFIKIPAKFSQIILFKLRGNGSPTGRDFMFIPKKPN